MATWPKTYRYLADCEDGAADDALVAAARQLEGAYLRCAIEVLLQRAQPAGLLAVIENYHRLPADVKRAVLGAEPALAPAMRTAVREVEMQTRLNCLEMASQIGSESLAYLFDLGLMDVQVRVREQAAQMLRQMSLRLLADHPLLRLHGTGDRRQPAPTVPVANATKPAAASGAGLESLRADSAPVSQVRPPADSTGAAPDSRAAGEGIGGTYSAATVPGDPRPAAERLAIRRQHLFEALLSGAQRYEAHLRSEVVEACLWFEPYLGERLWELVRQPRSRLGRLLSELLINSDEPAAACFLPQAMAMPDLRPSALKAISERRDAKWFQGVLRGVEIWHPWPRVRKAWNFLKDITYLYTVREEAWPQIGRTAALPILLNSSNISPERKGDVLAKLWNVGSPQCRRQVLFEACRSRDLGLDLLRTAVAESRDPEEVRMAAYGLLHMDYEGLTVELVKRLTWPGDPSAADLLGLVADQLFWRLWTRFDTMQEERRIAALTTIKGFAVHLRTRLRVNLAAASSSHRLRAVRMVGMLGLVDELWRDVLAVARDQNSRVRSAAVRVLGHSDRPELKQQLRSALDDPDGRVQANAIEAIEEAGWPDRLALIVPKLHSDNNRVRANAARTLARAGDDEAADVLSTMLQDSRAEHRATAVWTIKTIGAGRWAERLQQLAEHDPSSAVRRFAQSAYRGLHEQPAHTAGGKA